MYDKNVHADIYCIHYQGCKYVQLYWTYCASFMHINMELMENISQYTTLHYISIQYRVLYQLHYRNLFFMWFLCGENNIAQPRIVETNLSSEYPELNNSFVFFFPHTLGGQLQSTNQIDLSPFLDFGVFSYKIKTEMINCWSVLCL